MPTDLRQTLDLVKSNIAASIAKGGQSLSPELVKDFGLSSVLQPFNLEAGAKHLYPTLSPLRNMIARTKGKGTSLRFKAITNPNTTKPSFFVAEGVAANKVTTSTADVLFPYVSMGLGSAVTLEGQIQGEGQVDLRAESTTALLRAVMTAEEDVIWGGQTASAYQAFTAYNGGSNVSIGGLAGTPAAPTLAAGGTGGTIPTATYFVAITQVTGQGESAVSPTATQAVTLGQNVTVTLPAKPAGIPVLYYNVYIGTVNNLTGATWQKVVQASNGGTAVLTSYSAATNTPPAADSTGNSLAFNGILPQLAAANSGAYVKQVNGALALSNLDDMLKGMWDVNRADPNMMLLNSTESQTLSTLTLGTSGTPYILVVKDHTEAVAGYRVARLINKITGTEIPLSIHPTLPAGNILALSTEVPGWYPNADIPNVFEMNMVMDYTQLDYFPTGPTWPFEVRMIGALALRMPSLQGWIGGLST